MSQTPESWAGTFPEGYHVITTEEFRREWATSHPYRRFTHTASKRPVLATLLAHRNGGGIMGWLVPDTDCADLQ